MSLLKSNETFKFRSFSGREPTVTELREEMETMAKFFEGRIRELDKQSETRIVALENETP